MDRTKEQVLNRINENLEEFKNWGKFLVMEAEREIIIQLCEKFKKRVEEKMLTSLVDDWLFYDISVQPDGIELGIWNCEEINFDSDGEISEMSCVKEKTVKEWLRRGKIRCGVKKDGDWLIPELAERPGRKYRSVIYRWESVPFLEGGLNIDLKDSKGIYLHQGENGKIDRSVFLENSVMKISLNKKECERLEYQLLQNPKAKVEELEDRLIFTQSSRRIETNEHLDKMVKKLKQVENENEEESEKEPLLGYGPIVVRKGKYKGRIGYYEDDITDTKAMVYFGDMFTTNGYYEISHRYLSNNITISELVERLLTLNSDIAKFSLENIYPQKHIEYLAECLLAERLLTERYHSAMWETPTKDLTFARCLTTDLLNAGYQVFFADWSLKLYGGSVVKIKI